MAVAGPFLELRVRHPSEPLALAGGDRSPEDAEARHVELTDLCVDRRLEFVRIGAEHGLPVTDDNVLFHLVCFEHERAHGLGDAFESEAVLERLPHLA